MMVRVTDRSEDEENVGLVGICNPHLGTIEYPVISILLRPGLQCESI